jgi:succinate-semialdehyde dehydrogenase/glutarate-semialdehyde dehydrogenase
MFQSVNPFNGEWIANHPTLTDNDLLATIQVAQQAYNTWKHTPISQRTTILTQIAQLLKQNANTLAQLAALEMGKPVTQGIAEVNKAAFLCEHYANNLEQYLANEPLQAGMTQSYLRYEPLGVLLGIMPWNFPYWQAMRFAIPALASGNTILLKPAPNVCQCTLRLAQLFTQAGLPNGVFQPILATTTQVQTTIQHPAVKGVALTGSDRAGAAVAATAGKALKKTVLELGGSDPFLVLDDADLPQAAQTATRSRLNNAGQTCIAAKRVIVLRSVLQQFIQHCTLEIQKYNVADPLHPNTLLGPLARPDLLHNLVRQVQQSVELGAQLLVEGGITNPNTLGNHYAPTLLLAEYHTQLPIVCEETFGPVMVVIPADTLQQAIHIANDTPYGLGAAVWSANVEKATQVACQLEAGYVVINGMVSSDPRLPFGGIKQSGYGREMSRQGLLEFVNTKCIVVP